MLKRALAAEILKYRRTPALWLALGVPLGFALCSLLIFTVSTLSPATTWHWLTGVFYVTWLQLVLPAGVAILAALAVGLEHGNNQFKQLLILPPSRGAVYFAKLISLLGLVLAGTLVLILAVTGIGLAEAGLAAPIPWRDLIGIPLLAFLAVTPVLALGLGLALRWRSFALPVSIGFAGTIATTLAVHSARVWPYIPWSYPFIAISNLYHDAALAFELAGLLTLVFVLVSYLDFRRRDIL